MWQEMNIVIYNNVIISKILISNQINYIMEEFQIETDLQREPYITKEAGRLLLTISKWTKFLSILGFVMIGLVLLMLLFAGIFISGMNSYAEYSHMYPYMPGQFSWGFFIIYLIFLAIYFVPLFFLFKFSTLVKKAVVESNTRILTQSLRFLNNHYMVVGILAIVAIAGFIFSVIGIMMGVGAMMM